jgi:hypothetical protein
MADVPTFQPPEYRHGLSGTDKDGKRRNYTEEQARAQGTDGYGMPASNSDWGPGTKRKSNGTGSKKINKLVMNLDEVSLDSGTTIYQFFEALRNLCHQIGFQVDLGTADIRARAEHDAKKSSHWYAFGLDVKMVMRKFDKEAQVIVDSLADAAAASIKTWLVLNDEIIEPMIEAQGGSAKRDPKTVAWTD